MTGLEIGVLKTVGTKGAAWAWDLLRDRFIAGSFKQIFGDGVVKPAFALVYGELALNPQIQFPMPYVKVGGNPQGRFSMTTPVSPVEAGTQATTATRIPRVAKLLALAIQRP